MSDKLPAPSGKQVIAVLEKEGWYVAKCVAHTQGSDGN